jgi:hypothetical protein
MTNNEQVQTKEAPKRDESLVGGKYHGPSNQAGLTAREYYEVRDMWEEEERYNNRYWY